MRFEQDLDGQVAAEVDVAALEDGPHAAAGDLALELVAAPAPLGRRRHRRGARPHQRLVVGQVVQVDARGRAVADGSRSIAGWGPAASPAPRIGRPTRRPPRAGTVGHVLGQVHHLQAAAVAWRAPGARPAAGRGRRAGPPPGRRGKRRASGATSASSDGRAGPPSPGDRSSRLMGGLAASGASRSIARVQSIRTAPGDAAHPRGHRLERDVLQVTQDEDLAIVGRQSLQRVGQEHRLLAPGSVGAGRRQRRGQRSARPRSSGRASPPATPRRW